MRAQVAEPQPVPLCSTWIVCPLLPWQVAELSWNAGQPGHWCGDASLVFWSRAQPSCGPEFQPTAGRCILWTCLVNSPDPAGLCPWRLLGFPAHCHRYVIWQVAFLPPLFYTSPFGIFPTSRCVCHFYTRLALFLFPVRSVASPLSLSPTSPLILPHPSVCISALPGRGWRPLWLLNAALTLSVSSLAPLVVSLPYPPLSLSCYQSVNQGICVWLLCPWPVPQTSGCSTRKKILRAAENPLLLVACLNSAWKYIFPDWFLSVLIGDIS